MPTKLRKENGTQALSPERTLLLAPVFNTFPLKTRSVQAGVGEAGEKIQGYHFSQSNSESTPEKLMLTPYSINVSIIPFQICCCKINV